VGWRHGIQVNAILRKEKLGLTIFVQEIQRRALSRLIDGNNKSSQQLSLSCLATGPYLRIRPMLEESNEEARDGGSPGWVRGVSPDARQAVSHLSTAKPRTNCTPHGDLYSSASVIDNQTRSSLDNPTMVPT
jgi:hypothetical protein